MLFSSCIAARFSRFQRSASEPLHAKNHELTLTGLPAKGNIYYRITSTDLLVANCGQYCIALTGGGDYKFNHSTIANYWGYDVRQEPAFLLTNTFFDLNGNVQVRQVEASTFRNGIIDGNNNNEFELALDAGEPADFLFSNFLFRTNIATTDPSHFEQSTVHRNQSPGFKDASAGDFHLTQNAFARNKGFDPFGADEEATFDLDGILRPSDLSDLGCYTFVP